MTERNGGGIVTTPAEVPQQRRVRVWFGRHVIATHVAEAGEAERFERAMNRRFMGLTVTIDDEPSRFDPLLPPPIEWDRAPLPGERLR